MAKAPEADLTGWTSAPFTAGGLTHDVYRKGEGPGVVLIPEMPGIHPGVLALGNHLVDNGFTVASPSLRHGGRSGAESGGADHAGAGVRCQGIRRVRHQPVPSGVAVPARPRP